MLVTKNLNKSDWWKLSTWLSNYLNYSKLYQSKKNMQNLLQRDLGSSLLSIMVILGWFGLFFVFLRILSIFILNNYFNKVELLLSILGKWYAEFTSAWFRIRTAINSCYFRVVRSVFCLLKNIDSFIKKNTWNYFQKILIKVNHLFIIIHIVLRWVGIIT